MARKPSKRKPRGSSRSAGRPTLLTAEVQERFVKLILQGVKPRHRVCELCDIGERTYMTWMSSEAPRHRQFQQAIRRAEAQRIAQLTEWHHDLANPATNPNPSVRIRAIETELAWDSEYHPRARVEATGADGGPVQLAVSGQLEVCARYTPEQLAAMPAEQLAELLDKAETGEGGGE